MTVSAKSLEEANDPNQELPSEQTILSGTFEVDLYGVRDFKDNIEVLTEDDHAWLNAELGK